MKINQLKTRSLTSLPNGWHTDGGGLYFRVTDSNRYWVVRAYKDGVCKTTTIGTFPAMSLVEARALLHETRQALRQTKAKKTFAVAAAEALESIKKVKLWTNAKHEAQWFSTVEAYAIPKLGKRVISDITPQDVAKVLEKIWLTKTATAVRLRGRLKAIFDHAILTGSYTRANPADWDGVLSHLLPPPGKVAKSKHHDAVAVADIPATVAQIHEFAKASKSSGLWAALLGIFTATRAQEFALARWDEFDMDTKTWSIPPERRKDKKAYPMRVPITPQVEYVLSQMSKDYDYVFPAPKGGCIRPDTPLTQLKQFGFEFTMHGFRSTFRDWGAENGENPVYMEKALSHSTGNKVEQAYQRSDCLEQRRPIMERWGDYCMGK